MNIKVEKWEFDGERLYKILELTKCCDKITKSNVITLRDEYENDDDLDYSVKLRDVNYEYDSYDRDYYDYTTYESIQYCPFCGEKIDIEIVNTIDKTEEYLELKQDRSELWEKCRKTDSKKKESQLREEIYELDRKINEFHINDNFKEEEQ